MADLLLEVGLEEIPARMIPGAEQELGRRVAGLLERERLLDEGSTVKTFSTPRRLAVLVGGVKHRQPDVTEQMTGPAWKVAYRDGQPTPAAEAFARKAGVTVAQLEQVVTAKGEYVAATITKKGQSAADVLNAGLPGEIGGLYWAKNMYWRPGKPERYVRPVRWLLALLDEAVLPISFGGKTAGRTSQGHRILFGDAPVIISAPASYEDELKNAFVAVDAAQRKHSIRKALDRVTRTVAGARWREDESLVDTVTHLTEWPSVLLGSFEDEYLTLPEEVLVTVMRDHQKYFAVEDASGKLLPYFLTVLNTAGDPDGLIRHGNERVLRARFNDGRFFWNFDQKIKLADREAMLEAVTFHKQLGNYRQKTEENRRIAAALAALVQAKGVRVDAASLDRAALLAKTDLTAELVKEFTELQGIVGGLYARAQGESEAVAAAIYSQYTPASVEDDIPPTVEGQLFGLSDRIHTMVAMFGIGLAPTGSKDPFALRRAGNSVVKILAESGLPLSLSLLASAVSTETSAVLPFLKERLEYYLREVCGYSYDVVNAVLAAGWDDVPDARVRAGAIAAVRGSEDFAAVSAAAKRIKNILTQATEKRIAFTAALPESVTLIEPEEKKLLAETQGLIPRLKELSANGSYQPALEQIAALRPVVDGFFDKVMVMTQEEGLRTARLSLIAALAGSLSQIADFSEIVTV